MNSSQSEIKYRKKLVFSLIYFSPLGTWGCLTLGALRKSTPSPPPNPPLSLRHEEASLRPEEASLRHEEASLRPEEASLRHEEASLRHEEASLRPEDYS